MDNEEGVEQQDVVMDVENIEMAVAEADDDGDAEPVDEVNGGMGLEHLGPAQVELNTLSEVSVWFFGSHPDSEGLLQFWENLHYLRWRKRSKVSSRPPYAFKPLQLLRCEYKGRDIMGRYPLARSGHCVVASESHLYCLGGFYPRNELLPPRGGRGWLFQELWSYNFATNRWKLMLNAGKAANMPSEMVSNALEIHNDVLIAHGGTGYPFPDTVSNDCHVYTTNDKPIVVKLQVTGDLPLPQYGHGIVIHGGYLYTIGGTTGFAYTCDVYRLHLATKVWENVYTCHPEIQDDPEGRFRPEVVCDGRHIYVLGGGNAHTVYNLQRIPAFDLQAIKWVYFETLPDGAVLQAKRQVDDDGYPKARKCLSCVQHKTSTGDIEVFISGGLQGVHLITYLSDIWRLNLRTKQWSWIPATLPKPLFFHSAAHAGNGCMYIFGGIEHEHNQKRRTNELYKMWLTVPKLSEMCWDAINYYNENTDYYSTEKLLQDGIPERFEKRLPTARRNVRPKSQTLALIAFMQNLGGGEQAWRTEAAAE